MLVFTLEQEQEWNSKHHVEKILGQIGAGDFTVACWEPRQVSPYHCHPDATEIYFCFSGGGLMRTPAQSIDIVPGSFVVHPPGELHEYENGAQRRMPSTSANIRPPAPIYDRSGSTARIRGLTLPLHPNEQTCLKPVVTSESCQSSR